MLNFIARPAFGGKGWALQRSGATRATRNGLTRTEAWTEARRLARGAGTTAFLFGRSGRVIAMSRYDR